MYFCLIFYSFICILDVETYFMPWLMNSVAEKLEKVALVRRIADSKSCSSLLIYDKKCSRHICWQPHCSRFYHGPSVLTSTIPFVTTLLDCLQIFYKKLKTSLCVVQTMMTLAICSRILSLLRYYPGRRYNST